MNLKTELLEVIANKNRGLLAIEIDKIKILTAVEKLEDCNPNVNVFDNLLLLQGDWRLLYTTSKNILSLNNLPLVQLGEIYQCIRTDNTNIYNIAEIKGLPLLEGLICVVASFEIVSTKRVNIKFQRSIFGLQKILSYVSPANLINRIEMGKKFFPFDFSFGKSNFNQNNPQGWLEITYLDENLRIARGNEGNVFILERC